MLLSYLLADLYPHTHPMKLLDSVIGVHRYRKRGLYGKVGHQAQ